MYDLTNPMVIEELTKIANQNNGVLLQRHVVEAARSRTSILHKYFVWDNTKAADEYRLIQAGELIRVCVRYVKVNGDKRAVRVFMSLREDRYDGHGYRAVVSILSNKTLRRQMLEDALAELQAFERKYNDLRELSEIFAKSKEVRRQLQLAWAQAAA
jgi:hypothetical protein